MRARKSAPASVSVTRARGPDEKSDTDFVFQRHDHPRLGRLPNVQRPTGRGKPSFAGGPNEQPQPEEAVTHREVRKLNSIFADYSSQTEKAILIREARSTSELSAARRADMRRKLFLAFMAAFAALPLESAVAQVNQSGYSLPLALAMKAATNAIATCASNGYAVSAVVVDTSGVIKLEAKGDYSTILTTTSAFRKAYTVVAFGPIFRFDASSTFAELVAKTPTGAALATLPDIALLPGGVAIKFKDEVVAALGVGGSPGGDKDEACAQAGVASIKDDLPSSQ
jgi:uncharacterized protein GlcG (DUF336 family)